MISRSHFWSILPLAVLALGGCVGEAVEPTGAAVDPAKKVCLTPFISACTPTPVSIADRKVLVRGEAARQLLDVVSRYGLLGGETEDGVYYRGYSDGEKEDLMCFRYGEDFVCSITIDSGALATTEVGDATLSPTGKIEVDDFEASGSLTDAGTIAVLGYFLAQATGNQANPISGRLTYPESGIIQANYGHWSCELKRVGADGQDTRCRLSPVSGPVPPTDASEVVVVGPTVMDRDPAKRVCLTPYISACVPTPVSIADRKVLVRGEAARQLLDVLSQFGLLGDETPDGVFYRGYSDGEKEDLMCFRHQEDVVCSITVDRGAVATTQVGDATLAPTGRIDVDDFEASGSVTNAGTIAMLGYFLAQATGNRANPVSGSLTYPQSGIIQANYGHWSCELKRVGADGQDTRCRLSPVSGPVPAPPAAN